GFGSSDTGLAGTVWWVKPFSSSRHSLITHRSSAWMRSRNVAWIADALARGDKGLHRAVDAPESLDELGAVGLAARESGQLEVVDAHRCHEETDGAHWALRQLYEDMVRKAFEAGYAGVVLTADAQALRVLAPEPAERLAQEYDL